MKNIFKSIFILSGAALLVSCEKDEEKVMMNANARVESNLSATTLVLDKTKSNTTALTVSWEEKDFGVNVGPAYIVDLINAAGKKKSLSATSSPFALTHKELNEYLIGLGLEAGVTTDVTVAVKVALSDQRSMISNNTLKVTPYLDEIKPSEWGVVGSGTPNGWDGPDVKMWNAADGTLVAYATLKAGEIKFRKNNDWSENLGGTTDNLTPGGANIAVTAGTYKITLNVNKKTYSIEPYSWGLIGAGAKGWGDNDDVVMTYEGSIDSWIVKNVALDGEVKFRLNGKWDTNFGADSTDNPAAALEGAIKAGGNNIKVPAGTYNVSFKFNAKGSGTYKIVKQ